MQGLFKEKWWFSAPSLIAATGQQPHNRKDKDEQVQTFTHTHRNLHGFTHWSAITIHTHTYTRAHSQFYKHVIGRVVSEHPHNVWRRSFSELDEQSERLYNAVWSSQVVQHWAAMEMQDRWYALHRMTGQVVKHWRYALSSHDSSGCATLTVCSIIACSHVGDLLCRRWH